MSHFEIIGIFAGIIEVCAFAPYIFSMVRGKTRPHRGSWFIWTLVGFVLLVSYYQAGAEETIWVPLIMFVGPLVVFLLSFKYGVGGWEDPLDKYCLIGALVGVGCLAIFSSPLVALTVAIATDIFAALPTVKKSILEPASEDVYAWSLAFVANALNIAAIREWSLEIAGYPVYATLVFAIICFPLLKYHASRALHRRSHR